MKQTHIKLTSRKRFNKGRWMEYWHIDAAMFYLVPKTGTSRCRFQQKLGSLPSLARHPSLAASCSSFHFLPTISRGRNALELRLGGWTAEPRLTCQGKNGSQGTKKGFARTKLCKENNNLKRNSQKTYIASASSTSAKRSWGPGWKFDIALGCLKLQETAL